MNKLVSIFDRLKALFSKERGSRPPQVPEKFRKENFGHSASGANPTTPPCVLPQYRRESIVPKPLVPNVKNSPPPVPQNYRKERVYEKTSDFQTENSPPPVPPNYRKEKVYEKTSDLQTENSPPPGQVEFHHKEGQDQPAETDLPADSSASTEVAENKKAAKKSAARKRVTKEPIKSIKVTKLSVGSEPKAAKSLPTKRARSSEPPTTILPVTPAAPEVDLMLGIDFGTSCTKVVIGDHGWLGQSYVVPIGAGNEEIEKFLRPSQIFIARRNETNLKLRLMANPEVIEIQDLVTLYLAGVIRDSLKWFSCEASRRYETRTAVWKINLGFPAKKIEDGPLVRAYRIIGKLASALGVSELPLNKTSVKLLRRGTNPITSSKGKLEVSVELYPEIAAQLAGYVNSPYRVPGNLILVDVGAGTLDVSTLILHDDRSEDVVSFHFCEVAPLGAMKLLQARMEALDKVAPGSVRLELGEFQSGTKPTPENATSILNSGKRVTRPMAEAFEEESARFGEESIRLALSCATRFRQLQRQRHSRPTFDPWPGQLRFFFTGGGSRMNFFRHHFTEGAFEQELSRYTLWADTQSQRRLSSQGLKLEQLPVPADLNGLPAELAKDFDRFSVAHGLAYGSDNLMKITTSVHS
jgi:hypothetical protein